MDTKQEVWLGKPFLMMVGKVIMFFYNEHPPFLYEKLLMMLLVKRDYTGNILL
jgi:hypothetical protein